MVEKTDIAQQISYLIKLQDIDEQIYKLNMEKESKPEEIKQLDLLLSQKQSALKEAETAHKNLQLRRKEKEIDLESKENTVKKLQTQLYQIKTNKEYAVMLHEIESHKADNSLLEDDIIKIMEAIDAAEGKVREEKIKFEEETKRFGQQKSDVDKRLKEIEGSLTELKNKRDEITPGVTTKILKNYQRILAGRDALALVEVTNDACGGCNMQLPPQVINEIRMKENIICCESCQRMLYIKDEEGLI